MNSRSQKGFGMISLLLTIAVLSVLYFVLVNKLLKKPVVDAQTDRQLKEMTQSTAVPLDTSSRFAIKDSLVQQIKQSEQQELKRADDALKPMQTQGVGY